jgi:hypothetical protein
MATDYHNFCYARHGLRITKEVWQVLGGLLNAEEDPSNMPYRFSANLRYRIPRIRT